MAKYYSTRQSLQIGTRAFKYGEEIPAELMAETTIALLKNTKQISTTKPADNAGEVVAANEETGGLNG